MRWLDNVYYGHSLTEWFAAAATLGGVYLFLALLRRFLERRIGALAARTSNTWDDLAVILLQRTRWFFLLLVATYVATRLVDTPPDVHRLFRALAIVIALVQTGIWGNGIIGFIADRYTAQRAEGDVGTRTTIQALGYAGRFALWALLVVTGLQNFGINVTALVTGLGIGGIAIALAVQNILGDLFAALAIVLDKPFVVGDFIIVDDVLGTVEHVGLKTTRIRSLGGEQIVVANSDLLKSRVRNYKRMEQRRIVFHVDVTYDTPPETLNRIPGMIKDAVEAQPITRFDRSHFLSFADSSLRFETVYFVLDPDFNKYAATQHAINVEIVKRFNAAGIEFAFPSRTVFVRGGEAPPGALATAGAQGGM